MAFFNRMSAGNLRLSQWYLLILLMLVPLIVRPGVSNADDQTSLKSVLNDSNASDAPFWIYNDITAGFAEAKRSGKPLFVTFRCIPCKNCAGFDAEVANGNELISRLAREKFVSVRQVEMKNVDLSQFGFDFDLSWAAVFLNADGTVYARYGTQSAEGADAYNSVAGLQRTMEQVLAWHEKYPSNKKLFHGKRPQQKPYQTALQMPKMFEAEKRRTRPTTRSNCVHCHNIHDAEQQHAVKTGTFSREMLWRFPLPQNLGLTLDPRNGNTVSAVLPNSPADKAGLTLNSVVQTLNGQAIASIADFQWVLHHLSNKDETVTVGLADGRTAKIDLPDGWRKTDISWRGSIWSLSPKLGVWCPELSDVKKQRNNIAAHEPALEVRWINTGRPSGRSARKAGLKTGDIIVELDGKNVPAKSTQFNLFIKMNYKAGDELPLTVLRNGKRITVRIQLVE